MRIGLSCWEERIAPVFDTSSTIHIVEIRNGAVVNEAKERLPEDPLLQRILKLLELGIDVLVCGAISRSMSDLIAAYGIEVIPFMMGSLSEIVQAYLTGLEKDHFKMPGCHTSTLQPTKPGRGYFGLNGKGRNRNRQGAGQGLQRRVEPGVLNGDACCICPGCGHTEPHKRGVPCMQIKCPQCGSALIRQ